MSSPPADCGADHDHLEQDRTPNEARLPGERPARPALGRLRLRPRRHHLPRRPPLAGGEGDNRTAAQAAYTGPVPFEQPTKDPHQYQAKLEALGLPTPLSDIANTIVTTVRWLTAHHRDKIVFPIAEQPLITALEAAGIRMSEDPAEIDIVIASYDRTFDYRKLQIAFDALWFHDRGAILVQTNPDRYCPFPGGRGEPDCAAIVAAIEACTGVTCSANFGKPDPLMVAEALEGYDVSPARTMMVGDRLATDIAMGRAAGMNTALVLTGDSTLEEATALTVKQRPHYILTSLDQLIPEDVWDADGGASHIEN